MNNALVPIVRTLDLNTRLFLNALDGVDDSVATSRPNESTNHIAFIACHLVEARHYLGNTVGHESSGPFKALEGARRIDDIQEFPTVDEITFGMESHIGETFLVSGDSWRCGLGEGVGAPLSHRGGQYDLGGHYVSN